MFNFAKSFFGGGSYLGVDIGTTSIKIAEIDKSFDKLKLVNYGVLETYGHLKRLNDAIQTSSLKVAAQETADLLKTLLRRTKFKSANVIASIPAFASFVTLLDVPAMSESDTAKTLKFQIPQYIPLSPGEVNIDWLKVGEYEDKEGAKKQQILLVSVPNEKIARYREIFELAGLKLKVLEVETLSLARIFSMKTRTPVLIVDIGSRSTNIIIAQEGYLKHSTQIDFAGASLTQAIASGLGIDIRRAEELKKQRGILIRSAEYELSTLTLPFLDVIIRDIEKVKAAYENSRGVKIEKLILSGGGANLLGIEKYFSEQLGMEAAAGNALSLVSYPPKIGVIAEELGSVLAVAIGLGIKEFL